MNETTPVERWYRIGKEIMKKFKLVISDLDGTLLRPDHQVGEYTKSVIKKLKEKGYDFWIATGRHHSDAEIIGKKIGVETTLIAANGATVATKEGQWLHQAEIPREAVEGILKIPVSDAIFQNLYQGALWLMEREDEVFDDYYTEGDFKYTLCRFEDHLHKPINKIFFTSLSHDALVPVAEAIEAQFGAFVDWTFSMPECLEVMPKGANKGAAIIRTLEHAGYSLDEVVAFGDGMNDLEMLTVVPNGKIMENANPELIKRLPNREIIGHHKEESVAKWIETYFELV